MTNTIFNDFNIQKSNYKYRLQYRNFEKSYFVDPKVTLTLYSLRNKYMTAAVQVWPILPDFLRRIYFSY